MNPDWIASHKVVLPMPGAPMIQYRNTLLSLVVPKGAGTSTLTGLAAVLATFVATMDSKMNRGNQHR